MLIPIACFHLCVHDNNSILFAFNNHQMVTTPEQQNKKKRINFCILIRLKSKGEKNCNNNHNNIHNDVNIYSRRWAPRIFLFALLFSDNICNGGFFVIEKGCGWNRRQMFHHFTVDAFLSVFCKQERIKKKKNKSKNHPIFPEKLVETRI